MPRLRINFRSVSPIVLVLFGPLVLLAPVYLTGRALFWGTPLQQFVPWWHYAWQTLRAGHLPLWNPLVGMGAPLLANYQSALLYPPTWGYFLLYLLGGVKWMAWGQAPLAALHLAWAGLGMALLVRRMGMGRLPQVVAGLSYGLCGYLVARAWFLSINAAAAWLPWVLWCLTPQVEELSGETVGLPGKTGPGTKRFLLLTICLAMQLLSGHAQTTWYTGLLAGLWVLFWTWQDWRVGRPRREMLRQVGRTWLCLALAVALAAGLAAAQLLPTAEYLSQSQRSAAVEYDYAMNYSFWPWHLLTFLAPGMFGSQASGDYWGFSAYWEDAVYIGLLPLLLAFSALSGSIRRSLRRRLKKTAAPSTPAEGLAGRLSGFLALILVAALLLALGRFTPLFPWLYRNIPTFAMFQAPARWMLWVQLALSLLAAQGAQNWRRPEGWGLYWARLGTMGAFAVSLGAGLAWYSMGAISPSFIRATALLGFWGLAAGILTLTSPPRPPEVAEHDASSVEQSGSAVLPGKSAGVSQPGVKDAPADRSRLRRRLLQLAPPPSPAARPPDRPYPLRLWQWAVALVIALDLLAAGWGLNPAGPLDLYGPSPTAKQALALATGGRLFIPFAQENWLKYVRFLNFESFDPGEDLMNLRAVLLPNANILDGIASVNNFDPFVPGRYADWQDMLAQASPDAYAQMLDLMDVGLVETLARYEPYGVEFKATASVNRQPSGVQWVNCGWLARTPEQAKQSILNRDLDLSRYVVLEGLAALPEGGCQPELAQGQGDRLGMLAATDLGANRSQWTLTAPSAGWLVIPNVWYPGWRAWVDGQPAALLRANYLFQAVHVPSGDHTIVLAYRPVSFYAGLALSMISGLLSATLWRLNVRRKFVGRSERGSQAR